MARPKKNVKRYKRNPFIIDTLLEINIGKKFVKVGSKVLGDVDTGEETYIVGYNKVYMVDKSKFGKIFINYMSVFFDLGKPAQKIMKVIFMQMNDQKNRGDIYINWGVVDDFCKEENITFSRAGFYRGLNELIEKRFIAEGVNINKYYINPAIFFNGDRMVFIQEFRKADPALSVAIDNEVEKLAIKGMKDVSRSDLDAATALFREVI